MEGKRTVGVGDRAVRPAAPLTVVVAGGAVGVEPLVVGSALGQDGDPGVLDLPGGFDQGAFGFGGRDERGGVDGLLVEDVREVDAAGVLEGPHLDQVGETVAGEAVQGAGTLLRPRVQELGGSSAVHGELAGGDAGGPHGEARGEDQAVEFVGGVADHDTVLGDALDAVGVGRVDQGDVVPVERRVVRVGEGGALAGVPVPGLEGFRGVRVGDGLLDTGAQFVHLGRVGELVGRFEGLAVALPAEAGKQLLQKACGRGPAVGHQIPLGRLTGDDTEVVLAAVVRPARTVGADIRGGGPAVGAHVDGRGGALEDVDVSGVLGQHGNDLDAGGPGAHDPHTLTRESGHAPAGGASGVRVVPPRRVEGVAREVLDAGDAGEFRLGEGAGGGDDVGRPELVAAVGGHDPRLRVLVPGQ